MAKAFGTGFEASDMISVEREGSVTTITLDRPETKHALRSTDLKELHAHLSAIETPVVFLTGANGAFCSGADFSEIAAMEDERAAREFARLGQSVATSLESIDAIVIAGIDGPARGGGVELALACDIRVATQRATFAETGVRMGLFGAWGGTHRLPALIGLGRALDIALSGRVIDADEAYQIGLVTRIHETPLEIAHFIAEHDAAALATLKRRLRDDGSKHAKEEREAIAFGALVNRGPSLPD